MRRANKRRRKKTGNGLLVTWAPFVLTGLGAVGVAAGVFDRPAEMPWYALLLAAMIFAVGIREIIKHVRGATANSATIKTIEGPLLWSVMLWVVFRWTEPFVSVALFLPLAYLAWLSVISQRKVIIVTTIPVLVMEALPALLGKRPAGVSFANLAAFVLAGLLLQVFVRTEGFRQQALARESEQRDREEKEEYARELGLFDEQKKIKEALPTLVDITLQADSGKDMLEMVPDAINMQLALLRQALNLTTAALLWSDNDKKRLRLMGISTVRKDVLPGPYALGEGITGAFLRNVNEIAVSPVKPNSFRLPYYGSNKDIGGIYGIKVPPGDGQEGKIVEGADTSGLLLGDRAYDDVWSEEEKEFVRLTARKIALEVEMGKGYQAMHHEHGSFQRVCVGLRELNSALGLDSVFNAAVKAVQAMVKMDFLAISLLDGDRHVVVECMGPKSETLLGKKFAQDAGLVGQVIKLNHPLPPGASYPGPANVFSDTEKLTGYDSLLILPLRKEEGNTIGALTVAAREENVLAETHQDILALIAEQVAVKIDLGQAHEQISKMATTDGLTGLANHRTFQHGFEVMLERASRQKHTLCLILCDIDFFKKINDSYGHPFGDHVLRKVSAVLGKAVRKIDLAARYGGEEFAIVLEKSDAEGGRQMAERIRKEISSLPLAHERKKVVVTMSFGVATYPDDGAEKELLISRADKALYHSKENGRNQTSVWNDLQK